MGEYVDKNKKDLDDELFKCEVSFETQRERLTADIKEMRIKFSNLRIAHDKNIRIITNLCRENGVDINAVRIKLETHGVLPKAKNGLEFDIDEMKMDLQQQTDQELKSYEVVIGRGLDEALAMKEFESRQHQEASPKLQDGSLGSEMKPRFSGNYDESQDDIDIKLYRTNQERSKKQRREPPTDSQGSLG